MLIDKEKPIFFLSYFFYWSAIAAFLPYMGAFFESRNLEGGKIGLLISIPYFVNLIGAFSLGYLSDLKKRPVLIIRTCLILFILVIFFLSSVTDFKVMAILYTVYAISIAPINPILDDMTLTSIKETTNYGRIRIGGSIGWGLTILLVSLLINDDNYPIKFLISIIMMIFLFISSFFFPNTHHHPEDKEANLHNIGLFIRRKGTLIFLFSSMIWSATEACITGYLFLHIKSLGGGVEILGISMALAIVSEIVGFLIIKKLLKKFGFSKLVIGAFILQFLRLLFLTIIKNPLLIPPFQIFGGISFALIWASTVAFINKNSSPEIGKSSQAIKTGLSSLGSGIGVLLGGLLYQHFNTSVLYLILTTGIFFSLVVFFIMQIIKKSNNGINQI